jgi:tRNA 2-thiouridine synthesizing protein A
VTDINLANIKVAKIVDARGSACPGPLLEAKKGIGAVRIGEVLEILSSDPETKDTVPAWAKKVGHDYIGWLPGEGYDRIFVTRKR